MNVLSVYGTLKASSNEESNRQHTQSFPFLSQNPIFIRLNLDINLKRAKIGAFHYTVFSHFAYSILEPLHMIHLRNTIRFRFRWRIRIFFRWLDTRYRHFSWQEWFRDAIFVVVSSQTCRRVNRFQKKKELFSVPILWRNINSTHQAESQLHTIARYHVPSYKVSNNATVLDTSTNDTPTQHLHPQHGRTPIDLPGIRRHKVGVAQDPDKASWYPKRTRVSELLRRVASSNG